jgi:FSR family fosmidomycin resistance protein-like MFS transporter
MWIFVLFGSLAAAPILLISGFFLFSSTSVLLAVINDFDSDHPAFINGLFMTVNFISGASTVMLIGIMSDLIGMEAAYKISALFGFLTVPFILALDS